MLGDTIAAVSTPRGKGGVALLRVSGPDALAVASRVFCPKNQKSLQEITPRSAVYGEISAPDASGIWHSVDDGLATVFLAPASFTGENTVEIACHGGVLLTQTVLTALFAAGARPAEAGEFTRRAFLNGKLGLSAAEALGNILEANTQEQLALAHGGMRGKIEEACEKIYDSLRAVLASIYVKIDYPDEDLADMSREEIIAALDSCYAALESLAKTYRTGHAIAEGISTVICGRPNVGKSSLYNRIVGRDAAIVTDIEGTTRDVLSETVAMGRVTLRLFDTAGLHETHDAVEQIGIDRANRALEEAELILAVFDGSRPIDREDLALAESISQRGACKIAVLNKSDLGACEDAFFARYFTHTVRISAESGEGMDALCDLVEQLFVDGSLDSRNDAVLSNARQHASVLSSMESVSRALEALRAGYPIDLCCTDAEAAMESLCEVDGRAVSEDIVSEIFSHFCVGK
ncbi:MAG: tRNA uridine-5-carboxymethylaminomethyl(34) synthesis GTPase MnmE [Ruminococcaceae bacterium]|nr:tRNA uridine-5-carboxymethylaminomethyl(34) synthesis GTPase MnmE [Oscillospiraceae bacterium]